jgi:hypothetical protein
LPLTANIGLAERRKRHRAGVAGLLLGALVAFAAWGMGLPLALRGASAPFFFIGSIGILQARAHTCVALASRGLRDMDDGPEGIDDAPALAQVRAQAWRVLAQSVIATLLLTAVAFGLP